ncbi:5'-nucleotidase [Aureococcus anophagefferens]|nr:5'-nucleotidase [Aureococcus anophagefferens]
MSGKTYTCAAAASRRRAYRSPAQEKRSVGTDGTVFHTKKEWRKHEMLTQYTFYEKENHTFAPKKPGDVDGQAFDIRDLVGCEAAVCDATDMVQVDACKIMIGASGESVFIRECADCTFYVACKQLRLRDCTNCKFSLYSQTEPVIELSSGIAFTPFSGGFAGQEKCMAAANLNPAINFWWGIFDFNDEQKTGKNFTSYSFDTNQEAAQKNVEQANALREAHEVALLKDAELPEPSWTPHRVGIRYDPPLLALEFKDAAETVLRKDIPFPEAPVAATPRRAAPPVAMVAEMTAEVDLSGTPEFDFTQRVFCNRELNMGAIEAVGFDMDYTLAQYNVNFDMLAFEGAKRKLVEMGYPEEAVAGFTFDPEQHLRGLVIDKRHGNILKMDRHKYVRVAFHGTRELSPDERKKLYVGVADATPTFVGDDFVNVDSLFQLVDASLYAQLGVRHAVDMCHHDGVIKDEVAEDPGRYILRDDSLVPMLNQYRLAGKKVFLLTNSLFDYTNVVMNFLLGKTVDDRGWMDLFDVIVVGGGKPAFLGDGRRDMLRVDTTSNMGTLHNFVGKPVDEIGGDAFLAREGKVFQSGTWRALHEMLGIDSGSQLEHELSVDALDSAARSRVAAEETACEAAELAVQTLRLAQIRDGTHFLDSAEKDALEEAQSDARTSLRRAREAHHAEYHPVWGPMFRTGNQASRFAKQVIDYSCIYNARASNLSTSPSAPSARPRTSSPTTRGDRPHMSR